MFRFQKNLLRLNLLPKISSLANIPRPLTKFSNSLGVISINSPSLNVCNPLFPFRQFSTQKESSNEQSDTSKDEPTNEESKTGEEQNVEEESSPFLGFISRVVTIIVSAVFLSGLFFFSAEYLFQDKTSDRKDSSITLKLKDFFMPLVNWYNSFQDYEPAVLPLIPAAPAHMQNYVIIIDADDVLHNDQLKKYRCREFDDVVEKASRLGETCLWYSEPIFAVMEVDAQLDSKRMIPYKLFQEEISSRKGKNVYDLTYLARDLDRVVVISSQPDKYFPRGHVIKIPPYNSQYPDDERLLDAMNFVEEICCSHSTVPKAIALLEKHRDAFLVLKELRRDKIDRKVITCPSPFHFLESK